MKNLASSLAPSLSLLALLAPLVQAQSTQRASVASGGAQGNDDSWKSSISADGRWVVFESWATTLVPNDGNGWEDVFVRDLVGGTTVCVSVDPSGAPGNFYSHSPSISADGRFVAFASAASNLVSGDANATEDVFVRDLVAGTTVRASVDSAGVQGNGSSNEPSLSADGSRVAFSSFASNLVAGDTNGLTDVFVHDFASGQTLRASVSSAGVQGNSQSRFPALSGDGTCVAFVSDANNLVTGDSNTVMDGFVRELAAGLTTRISVNSAGVQANWSTEYSLAISNDGRYVAFATASDNMVGGDTLATMDLFLRDRFASQTTCLSLNQAGAPGSGWSGLPSISAGGRFVAFTSISASLVPGDTNNHYDEFVRDLLLGRTTRVSVSTSGAQASGESNSYGSLSADGRWIAFDSSATDLVAGDTNGFMDVFLRDRGLQAATPFCFGDGTQPVPCPCANSGSAGSGCENSAGSGGALLWLTGFADPDSTVLTVAGMNPNPLTIFLQGDVELAPAVSFGDGLRCAGGNLKRLYTKTGFGGSSSVPGFGDLPLGLRSAALGDPLLPGANRCYQVYYRDSSASFCPAPAGDLWNISNGVRVAW